MPLSGDFVRQDRRDQTTELIELVGLYGLQVVNAEMLRRSLGLDSPGKAVSTQLGKVVALFADHLHPLAMVIFGVWLGLMAVVIARGKTLERWALDGPGLWFSLRLVLEFLTINVLIFLPSLVPPGVLLFQIVVYLPYFVISWGWIFQRLDWVSREHPGQVIQLSDVHPDEELSRFDYLHSTANTLLNKGKPTIIGVNRSGRIAVLVFNSMLLALYAVAFARILQLTKATL